MKVDCPNLAVLRQRVFEHSPSMHISGHLTAYHVVRRNDDLSKYHIKFLQCFPSLKRHGFPTVGLCTLAASLFWRTANLGFDLGICLCLGLCPCPCPRLCLCLCLRLCLNFGLGLFTSRYCHLCVALLRVASRRNQGPRRWLVR